MALLHEKVSLVTGGGSGIGRAIAIAFSQAKSSVVISDIDERGGTETVAAIHDFGGSATFVAADSSSPQDSERLVNEALRSFGRLHIAVNNAGIGGPPAPTGDYPIEAWNKVIAVNLSGVFYGMRFQIPAIEQSGGGSIINISSILGEVAFANASAYTAAKHGVVGLTKAAALEYAPLGIRINSVGPGFIKTPLVEKNLSPAAQAAVIGLHPMGRMGEPEEVAELVLWLASDKSSFVTGSFYAIDGGYLTH